MHSQQSNEERTRITITAERHDELVAAEARLKELHGAGLSALELVGRTMLELARARQAGRRLAGMHKRKLAELETGWGVGADALREALDITLGERDELKVRVQEAFALLTEGVEVVTNLEAERDEAIEEVNDAKGREAALTGVLNKLSDKYRLLKKSKEEDGKDAGVHARILDGLKFHLDFNGSSEWEPNAATTLAPSQVAHAVCDGAIKPDFFVERDGTVKDLNNLFEGGGTMTAWIAPWEKCYEARRLAEHWRDTWGELHGHTAKELPWESKLVSESRRGKTHEWYLHESRDLAEHWRGKCEEHAPTLEKFPWEEEDDATASG